MVLCPDDNFILILVWINIIKFKAHKAHIILLWNSLLLPISYKLHLNIIWHLLESHSENPAMNNYAHLYGIYQQLISQAHKEIQIWDPNLRMLKSHSFSGLPLLGIPSSLLKRREKILHWGLLQTTALLFSATYRV